MSKSVADIDKRNAILFTALFVVIGFILRCLAAQGGLWTDEAWSLVYAQKAGDALGVLTRINHDNNHHINSWWLQLVGPDASPMLMRGLSIITSSLMIWVAALIGLRRNNTTGVITAALFALSPIMLVYGSEARGYAPMLLSLLIMIWRIDIWLEDQSTPKPTRLLALCAFFGSFSHLTLLPGVIMLGLWVFLAEANRGGMLKAAKVTADLLGPALAVTIVCIASVLAIATNSETGLQIGGYTPFHWPIFALAISNLISFALGFGYAWHLSLWLIVAIAMLGVAMWLSWWQVPAARKWFYAILILTMPVAVGILGVGNSQYPRYYLLAAVGILLLLAEWIGQLAVQRMRIRAAAMLCLLLGLAMIQNHKLIVSQRGQPERAVDIMANIAPKGAKVTIAADRASAILKVAAAAINYPLTISWNECSRSEFHFVAGMAEEGQSQTRQDCGPSMRLIAYGHAIGPSGERWSLYQRQVLPRPIAAVSSALPRQ